MDLNDTLSELTPLPVTDRRRIVKSLWDGIECETAGLLSPEQRDEINRRAETNRASPSQLLTWDHVLDQLRP